MELNQGQTVKGIMSRLEGVDLHERKGAKFRFRMHMTPAMSGAALESLDLGVRAYNSLKRAGYSTVGELTDALSSGMDLRSIRNCGRTSIREIMEHLFLFQYHAFPEELRDDYLKEVVRLNL